MVTRTLSVKAFLAVAWLCAPIVLGGCQDQPFSFAVLADPHLYGEKEHEKRLRSCVAWINANRRTHAIDLVFVLGDIGKGRSGLRTARSILNGLTVPFVPVLGDNEIQKGDETEFNRVFEPHYRSLEGILDNWRRQPTPVWNPEHRQESFLQNFSFDHRGLHFLGIDWCTRIRIPIIGEQADLHDFPGGTFPWFQEDIEYAPKDFAENILMMSHHPMHDLTLGIGGFDFREQRMVEDFTRQYGKHVFANFAGHYHLNWHTIRFRGQFELIMTDGTWDDENTIRIVRVENDGRSFSYSHQLVVIP